MFCVGLIMLVASKCNTTRHIFFRQKESMLKCLPPRGGRRQLGNLCFALKTPSHSEHLEYSEVVPTESFSPDISWGKTARDAKCALDLCTILAILVGAMNCYFAEALEFNS